MSYLRLILIGILILVAGLGLGYYFAPDKVKTEVRTVEVEKKVIEQHTITVKEFDPNTGKLTKETNEAGSKVTNIDKTATDKIKITEKTQKMYAVKVGIAKPVLNSDKPYPRLGAEFRLPFFNSSLGVEGDITTNQPTVGAYVRFEF